MNIRFAVPRTFAGRVTAALLVVVGVVVVVFFFAAILVIAAAGVVVWFLRSLLSGPKPPRPIKPDEVSAEYEVLNDTAQGPHVTGQHLLSGSPDEKSPETERGSARDQATDR